MSILTRSEEDKLGYPTCELNEDFHLFIPSRFPPVPLYERLGPSEIQKAAVALEAKTNPRLQEIERLSQGEQHVGYPARLQNWNLAPFAYPNPHGSTFLSPIYRIPEFTKGTRPALAIAVQRREVFLRDTAEPPIAIEMRELVRRVKGRFTDLTGERFETDQAKRWQIGAELFESQSQSQGIVFYRPGFANMRAVAVFDPEALGRVRQADHYRFVWDGAQVCTIGNFSTDEILKREELFAEVADYVSV